MQIIKIAEQNRGVIIILLRLSEKINGYEVINEIISIDYIYVADIIYDYFTNAYIKEYINRNFENVSDKEMDSIINLIKNKISKNIILIDVLERVEASEIIDIEGIINFRFNDYKSLIVSQIEDEIYKLIGLYEYEEYITLLEFYIAIQESQCKILNLFCEPDGTFKITDESFLSFEKGLIGDSGNFENDIITDGDILVSRILELAPQKIILHGINYFSNKNLLKTINRLFYNKINYCMGCEHCTR